MAINFLEFRVVTKSPVTHTDAEVNSSGPSLFNGKINKLLQNFQSRANVFYNENKTSLDFEKIAVLDPLPS